MPIRVDFYCQIKEILNKVNYLTYFILNIGVVAATFQIQISWEIRNARARYFYSANHDTSSFMLHCGAVTWTWRWDFFSFTREAIWRLASSLKSHDKKIEVHFKCDKVLVTFCFQLKLKVYEGFYISRFRAF